MALRRDLTRRLSRLPTAVPPLANAAPSVFRRDYLSSPDAASRGFFRRFLQRRAINQASLKDQPRMPQFLTVPMGEKLRESMKEMNIGRIQPDDTRPPAALGLTAENVRRIVKAAQVEKIKEMLKSVPESTVPYSDYLRICVDACKSETQGREMARLLDESANVVVWGDVVFLRPHQIAKSLEKLLWRSMRSSHDPRRRELEEMEKQKAQIDREARLLVRRELYCGLGLMVAQTLGFIRLTFWELSWDVMEPICFFVTSAHFAMAYTFFLRTSTEPSFEGFYRNRFRAKQARLMKLRGFDLEKFEKLCAVAGGAPVAAADDDDDNRK